MVETTTKEISFENTVNAFAYKSDKSLKSAQFLFKSMSHNWLVKLGTVLTPLAIDLHLPIKWLLKRTIFAQFVGGETLEKTKPVVQMLAQHHVKVILDYGVEGKEDSDAEFDHATQEFIKVIRYAGTQPNIPFISVKVTGFASSALLARIEKGMSEKPDNLYKRYTRSVIGLNMADRNAWDLVQDRMKLICDAAAENNVGVLIDAEESWLQGPVDALSMVMMDQFNTEKTVVYNTIQLYRTDRLAFFKECIDAARQRKVFCGMKLVRGAYMEKERARAQEEKYPSPIQPDKEGTDRDFDAAVLMAINSLQYISVIIATHNEKSNLYAVQLLQERGLPLDHDRVHFSQLYGMSDNITFNLAKAGCSVSKYLPFGPVNEVIPYLMRRAEENSSVSGQTGRELALIQKEMRRRKLIQ